MPDLFLSYARDDQAIARRYAEGLGREGFGVWWDQALNPGEAFDQVTEQALAEARAVIVLWSKSSVSSRWVRAEATQANAAGRLLPVMIEPCTRPIMFELVHTADLAAWKGNHDDPAWQAFVASVRRFVQRKGGDAGLPALLAEPVPAPTLRQRLSAARAMLRTLAVQAGALLRRFGGRLAFLLAGVAIASLMAMQLQPRPVPEVTRFTVPPPEMPVTGTTGGALSRDGRRFAASSGNPPRLFSLRMDQGEWTPIPGGEGGIFPFFSPDGRSLAFFTFQPKTQLKVFDFGTEAVRVVAELQGGPGISGAWDEQGRIFFSQFGNGGILRVADVGGVPEVFAAPDRYLDLDHPLVLPGGQWVLFTAISTPGNASGSDIVAQHVESGERRVVVKGGHFARYLPTGHLLFARGGNVYAVAFDAQHAVTRGREVPVVPGVATDENLGSASYLVADNGTFFYVPGTAVQATPTVTAVVSASRTGEVKRLSAEPRFYSDPCVSPDGTKIALEVEGDGSTQIWVMDAASGSATQLTFEGENRQPVWTADGREILFRSKRGDTHAIFRKAADGTGEARHVLDGNAGLVPTDIHGSTLVYQDSVLASGQRDIYTFDLAAGGKPKPLLATAADESSARVSPDGRWVAYTAALTATADTGDVIGYRVYVRPFPEAAAGGQRAISEGGGLAPAWSPDGDQIYYLGAEPPFPLYSAALTVTPGTLTPTGRRRLFDMIPGFALKVVQPFSVMYSVSPKDGEFIAMVPATQQGAGAEAEAGSNEAPRGRVVLNWFEELKKLVPAQ